MGKGMLKSALGALLNVWTLTAHAASPTQRTRIQFSNITGTLSYLIDVLWVLLIGAATISFLLAGYRYVVSQGNPEQVRVAHKMILYGAIALAVGLVARGLVFFVTDVVCGGGTIC